MSALEVLFVLVAGVGAGAINAAVGTGTLITFPVLLAIGYPPVVANVSNSIGLVPGAVAGALGYRAELVGQRRRVLRLAVASISGGIVGAAALLLLPASAFDAVVPVFVGLAVVLVAFQPRISAWVTRRREARARQDEAADADGGLGARIATFACGIYGGYFGAAQGVMFLATVGAVLPDDLQRINALKNVLVGMVNGVAGLVFVFAADVAWLPTAIIAVGATVGGFLGARFGRRLRPELLRGIIIVVGVVTVVRLALA
ncbi:MAG: sulfite exporter TauE/SafE family protein [Solirubrobacterales bacterium]|nr:sulfite exporter TauE/SafE family protein [Solirubrobacterales bacterium]